MNGKQPRYFADLLETKLREIGAAGLVGEECGCGVDDLMPGSACPGSECQAARRIASSDPEFECWPDNEEYGPLDEIYVPIDAPVRTEPIGEVQE